MAQLSAHEITALADNLTDIADRITEYRQEHRSDLSPLQKAEFERLIAELLNTADKLYTESAVVVIEEAEASLDDLNEVIEDIKSTYASLRRVQKAIDIAAGVIALGAAVLSKNPQSIGKEISGLVKAWRDDRANS